MRFALVGPTIEENLSLAYLAAALRAAGHEAVIVPFIRDRDHREAAARVSAERPDAVGLSMTFQSRARGFLALADDLRCLGFAGHVVAGGHWASLAAETLLRGHPAIDSVLRGEAETSIAALAGALAEGGALDGIPGILFRRAGDLVPGPVPVRVENLDALPLPARDGSPLRHLGIPTAPIVGSRGCRARCSFCSIASFSRISRGPVRRVRSTEAVAGEMGSLWRERGVRVFVFQDDDFFEGGVAADLERADRLGAAMRGQELPPVALVVKARPDDIHPDVVDRFRAIGLVRVFLGVETDAPAGLRTLGRNLPPDANRRALGMLARAGVFVCSNLLLWDPDTTIDDLRRNLRLMADFPDQLFNLARTELYEEAPLTRRLAAAGRLGGDYLGRDYRVADPRAELAWRVFRVALGDHCYPLDGVVNQAMGLAYDARLLLHLCPSERAERLAAEAAAEARRTAAATTFWMERIVAYAETAPLGPAPEVLQFALDAARAVRAEDAARLPRIRTIQTAMERCARGLPDPVEAPEASPRCRGRLRLAAGLAAGLGLAGCSKPPAGAGAVAAVDTGADVEWRSGAAGGDADVPGIGAADAATDASVALDAVAPDETARTDAAVASDSDAVALVLAGGGSDWQHCEGTVRTARFTLRATLTDTAAGARFERFETTDGRVSGLYVSPDGLRAEARFAVGTATGVQSVTAVFAREEPGAGTLRRKVRIYQYGDGNATVGTEPQPEPECYHVCDMAAPPPDSLLARDGAVLFGLPGYESNVGWATPLRFSVGVSEVTAGEVEGIPEATCTQGQVHVRESSRYVGDRWSPPNHVPMPPVGKRFDVEYDPAPADGSGRLTGGRHTCTFRFRVRSGAREETVEGVLPIVVDADGTVRLGAGTAPGTEAGTGSGTLAPGAGDPSRKAPGDEAALPLPLRYAVEVRCRADFGEVLLLGVECPAAAAAGEPSFLWWVSGGRVEPAEGGESAVWHLPDDGAPAVAVCAVQTGALDLQVASYRVG